MAQTVTVTGGVDGGAYTIVTEPATSDTLYTGIVVDDVAVTNTEVADIIVTPTSGLLTNTAGGTATFTIVLTGKPTADVTIPLTSSDTTGGRSSPRA